MLITVQLNYTLMRHEEQITANVAAIISNDEINSAKNNLTLLLIIVGFLRILSLSVL